MRYHLQVHCLMVMAYFLRASKHIRNGRMIQEGLSSNRHLLQAYSKVHDIQAKKLLMFGGEALWVSIATAEFT